MIDAEVDDEEAETVEVIWKNDRAQRAVFDALVEICSVGFCDFSSWWRGSRRGEMGIEGRHYGEAIVFEGRVSMDVFLYDCIPCLVVFGVARSWRCCQGRVS